MSRRPAIHHCTSQPFAFFGRRAELALLDEALVGGPTSVAVFVGPGGQGKTAIVQHWLHTRGASLVGLDGVFLWSFYRGKESDSCLRHLFAYAEGMSGVPAVSASFCVDRLIPRLRVERWAIVLDGAEVVQHEQGAWRGRFLHPELGRLVETLAEEATPGVLALTTRFELPTLATRYHAQMVSLGTLDVESGVALLASLGVEGDREEVHAAAGGHAKAVELLGTWLVKHHHGDAAARRLLPELPAREGSDEERYVLRILTAYHQTMPAEDKDMLALATSFHQPPTEACLVGYLLSRPVRALIHEDWQRAYVPFEDRGGDWVRAKIQEFVELRLLERVSLSLDGVDDREGQVLDAHPLVRRGFEEVRGIGSSDALARAGFLRGRPDRRAPATLAEAREVVELFHASCAAGLWSEADGTLRGLDNPKHRFLAPAFERDLLLRFFPGGDWRQPSLWPGFGRSRSLAICFEMLGQFEEALETYRLEDAPLRGDALIALGRLEPLANTPRVGHPWQSLWHAYRTHALSLMGQREEALNLVRTAWPMDIYEWVHIFEALLRLGRLDLFDPHQLQATLRGGDDSQWTDLARRRILADHRRLTDPAADIELELRAIIEAYDLAGLPFERVLARLSGARTLQARGELAEAASFARGSLEIATRHSMSILEADARGLLSELAGEATCYLGRP